jgi:hypothetical protein
MENLNLDINLKYIRKTSRKIIKNKYLTYFVALFTIFHISESLINSDNITFVKLLFQNNILKVLVFMLVVIIGYFNMTLGFLLLLNFIFVINIPQKVEGFANSLPNLIDKNELLKYKNNFVSNEPTELKYKSNEEMTKKINEEGEKSKNETKEKKIEKEFTKNDKTSKITINNPINLKDSEKLEEITDKMKKNDIDTDTNTDTDIDEKSSLNLKKQKLREELEKLEKDEKEIKDLKENEDDTIESDIKEKELDKRLRLSAMEEEDDESSSSSSNSSGSSSSSDSSEDSDKDYDEVSINDARDHVMKKLRNKLKRKYVKGK